MWECPDYFEVDGQGIAMFSPMGFLEIDGVQTCQNICMPAAFDEGSHTLSLSGAYQYADYGLDLYASQSLLDEAGRRVMLAWMRMPEPVNGEWSGIPCIPRVVEYRDGKTCFRPHPNIRERMSKKIGSLSGAEQGNALFEANPGGAPCNVLAMLHNLGCRTAFIGKVGDDVFGHMLKAAAAGCGIDTSGVVLDGAVHTTLAFVHTAEGGERDFSFYRDPGVDMMLREGEVRAALLENTKIFHFGTLSSTYKEVREATRFAVETAKAHGALLPFDPNLHEPLWESLADAKGKSPMAFPIAIS